MNMIDSLSEKHFRQVSNKQETGAKNSGKGMDKDVQKMKRMRFPSNWKDRAIKKLIGELLIPVRAVAKLYRITVTVEVANKYVFKPHVMMLHNCLLITKQTAIILPVNCPVFRSS